MGNFTIFILVYAWVKNICNNVIISIVYWYVDSFSAIFISEQVTGGLWHCTDHVRGEGQRDRVSDKRTDWQVTNTVWWTLTCGT